MKARCNNSQHPQFKHYGGRGIKVCKRWELFVNFLADMGTKPYPEATLDRINNNSGYEPANCRWATVQEQQKNRRNNNEIVGIKFEPERARWRADIAFKGERYFLGRFRSKAEAVKVREEAESRLWYAV